MNIVRFLRAGSVCLLCLGLFGGDPLHGQDGVCKKDNLPVDYVAVAEFNSPECDDGSNPLAMNAWRVERVRDGITVYALPSYQIIGARVAELVACESVHSERCSVRLDGLPNAMVLRSPAECVRHRIPADLEVKCSATSPLTDGAAGYMIAQLTSANCPPAPPEPTPTRSNRARDLQGHFVHSANAWLARKADLNTSSVFAVCADDFNIGPNDFIVRRFYSANCPVNSRIAGAGQGLTGWIIFRNPPAGTTITICEGFTSYSDKWSDDRYWVYRRPLTKYSDLCGGQPGNPNSLDATFPISPHRGPRRGN